MCQIRINWVCEYVTRTRVKRLVGDSVIERVRKVLAVIADDTKIRAETQGVVTLDPREIVGNVLCRRSAAETSCKQVRGGHTAEGDCIHVRVTGVGECFTG